jgi:hypothetical protein
MSKRILCLGAFLIMANTYNTFGQVRSEYFRSLFVDFEANGGLMTQNIKAIPFSTNYTDALNARQGDIKFKSGTSRGYNFNLGYYFDRKRSFGVGVGLNYYRQQGNLSMDTFHVEYRSTDVFNGTFRQVISTTRSINEAITTSTYNIPILLRYKKDFGDRFALTVDAGLLYNLSVKNTYNTDASFDYEAIYKFEGTLPVYDGSAVPDQSDNLITRKQFILKNPTGDVVNYFRFQDSIGKSVGLNLHAHDKSGNVKYKSGSLGYTGEVAINYMVYRNIYLRLGAYYSAQSFTNTTNNNSLRLTDQKVKDAQGTTVNYNSLLNEVQSVNSNNFGLVLGVKVYFNRMAWRAPENDMNKITPARGRAN